MLPKHERPLTEFKRQRTANNTRLVRKTAGAAPENSTNTARSSKNNSETSFRARVTVQETLNMPVAARTAARSKARPGDQTETRVGAVPFPACPAFDTLASSEYQNVAPRGESEDRPVKRREAKRSGSRFLPARPHHQRARRLQSAALNPPVNWF